jgi:hypothetical protein
MLAGSYHKKKQKYKLSLNKFLRCMFMSHQQNTLQDDNIKIANKSFENLAEFTYLEIKLTYQNYILEEVKFGELLQLHPDSVFLFAI